MSHAPETPTDHDTSTDTDIDYDPDVQTCTSASAYTAVTPARADAAVAVLIDRVRARTRSNHVITRDIGDALGLSAGQAGHVMTELRDRGLVTARNPDARPTRWTIHADALDLDGGTE